MCCNVCARACCWPCCWACKICCNCSMVAMASDGTLQVNTTKITWLRYHIANATSGVFPAIDSNTLRMTHIHMLHDTSKVTMGCASAVRECADKRLRRSPTVSTIRTLIALKVPSSAHKRHHMCVSETAWPKNHRCQENGKTAMPSDMPRERPKDKAHVSGKKLEELGNKASIFHGLAKMR